MLVPNDRGKEKKDISKASHRHQVMGHSAYASKQAFLMIERTREIDSLLLTARFL